MEKPSAAKARLEAKKAVAAKCGCGKSNGDGCGSHGGKESIPEEELVPYADGCGGPMPQMRDVDDDMRSTTSTTSTVSSSSVHQLGTLNNGKALYDPKTGAAMCQKCNDVIAVVKWGSNAALCGSCLAKTHKSAFGKAFAALATPPNRLIIAYSGGSGSVIALHAALELAQRKLNTRQPPVAIQALVVTPPSTDPTSTKALAIAQGLKEEDVVVVPLSAAYAPQDATLEVLKGPVDAGWESSLAKALGSFTTPTAKEDFVDALTRRLLSVVSGLMGSDDPSRTALVYGTSQERAAVSCIASILKGTGYPLPLHTAKAVPRLAYTSCAVLRPWVSTAAVCLAGHVVRLPTGHDGLHTRLTWASPRTIKTSLNTLAESFVLALAASFPATVRTILSTASKLSLDEPDSASAADPASYTGSPCALCCDLRSASEMALSSAADTNNILANPNALMDSPLDESICYSCRLILRRERDSEVIDASQALPAALASLSL